VGKKREYAVSDNMSFVVGIEFGSVLSAISKQIYETPMAFIRENVQNAVDAVRIQAHRDSADLGDPRYRIDITVKGDCLIVKDNGNGMSGDDLQEYFWTIGASGKRTGEAIAAGCVGMFGIGGFANFGVCDKLEVVSQIGTQSVGTYTSLSKADIEAASGAIPSVTRRSSKEAAPRGTIVTGRLREAPNAVELRKYLTQFVRYVPVAIYFDGKKLSQQGVADVDGSENLTELSTAAEEWRDGDLLVSGRFYEDRGNTLVAAIDGLMVGSEKYPLIGRLRFENGALNAFKYGFKLCATQVPTVIGVSGRLDCAHFTPTAGRDSLDGPTASLLGRIVGLLERIAIEKVLASAPRIAQNARIFRYVVQRGMFDKLDNVPVRLADGSETTLGAIKRTATDGKVAVYFGTSQKQTLNQVMQARGHIVVLLSADRFRRNAEEAYLKKYCSALPFDGIIDCTEIYQEITRFERLFLSELEMQVDKSYAVENFKIIPGYLTEDIPVYVRDQAAGGGTIEIFVDVRHQEVAKLESLGVSEILYSLIGTFCREYLGPSLKKYSPRFFGDGAINLELLARKRSELWVLLKDDIGIMRKGGKRQVVTRSDVQVINVASGETPQAHSPGSNMKPRILHVVADDEEADIAGFYIRLPEPAFNAYGDLIPECDGRGVVWAGNKILYVASDAISASFQYEIRLDEIVSIEIDGEPRAEGAARLERPLQQVFGGLYFPIPMVLVPYLVPKESEEIRLALHCDWIDIRTAKQWSAHD
jgi:molecular chaperone HtpG